MPRPAPLTAIATPASSPETTAPKAPAPVTGRVVPEPAPTLGDRFEAAAFRKIDKVAKALDSSGRAPGLLGGAVKAIGATGLAGDMPPELLESLAHSANIILKAEYQSRPTQQSFEERSKEYIEEARQGAPVDQALEETDAFHNAAFLKELEQVSGAAFTEGNRVEFLHDGPASFAKRRELIDNARESINILTWHIYGDDTGIDLCDRLIEKAAEGIQVRVIVDNNNVIMTSREKTLQALEAAGIKVIRWQDPDHGAFSTHCKLMVVDDKAAIVGGTNPGNEYSHAFGTDAEETYAGPKWRDTDMLVEGPAAVDTLKLFANYWNQQVFAFSDTLDPDIYGTVSAKLAPLLAKAGQPGSSKAAVVHHAPGADNFHVYSSILKAIEGATETIDIENAYFLTMPGLDQLLLGALMRGVKVRILTNSDTSVDVPMLSEALLKAFPDLLASGAEVYLKRGETLHSKFLIVDGSFASVGSLNLHPRSLFYDTEMAINVIDRDEAAKLTAVFEKDITDEFAKQVKVPKDLEVNSEWFNRFLEQYFFDHF